MDLSYVKSLSFPLPEELEKLKGAGYFDEFKERAKYHLDRENLPEEVKKRIILEMHNADVKLREYTLTESELIEQIAEYAPGFSSEDFKKLAGDTDYIFVNGEKRYVDFSVASLFITSLRIDKDITVHINTLLHDRWTNKLLCNDTTKIAELSIEKAVHIGFVETISKQLFLLLGHIQLTYCSL